MLACWHAGMLACWDAGMLGWCSCLVRSSGGDKVNLGAQHGELERKVGQTPFIKGRRVTTALFVKKARKESFPDMGCRVLTPGMVIDCLG
jgi:hypothetical protein